MVEKCVQCGICTANCEFLKKHDINLLELHDEKAELCYECLLCGNCSLNCPSEIDGREMVLNMRRTMNNQGKLDKKRYKSIILEKNNYLFKNYSGSKKETVLFPGCNFPSFFPETTKKLIELLHEKLDAGVAFDCCGKPIEELGLVEDGQRIIHEINSRLLASGAKRLVTVCPNCYYFLKGKLDVEVIDIYSILYEIGYVNTEINGTYNVFTPCPDRKDKAILENIAKLVGKDARFEVVEDVQCCGLGGLASCVDKTIPKELMQKLKDKGLDSIYTYCATCYGNFSRSGINEPHHFLTDILNSSEKFPKGVASVLNRASFKFKRFK